MTLILSGTDGLSDIDGSAATPAIRGTDANTGIFFPAADTIGFAEGGTEVMRINSSGNVGIGTSSVATTLDVRGANKTVSDQYGVTNIYSTDTFAINKGGSLSFGGKYATDGSVQTFGAIAGRKEDAGDGGWAGYIQFATGAPTLTERMRIDSSGNVGIGTTSPRATFEVTNATNSGWGAIVEKTAGSGTPHGLFVSTGQNSSSNFLIKAAVGTFASSTDAFLVDGTGVLKFNSGYGSAATAYGCRAWVNFNGQSSAAIRGSGNISSITINGTGDWTLNFATAMPDANYAAVFGSDAIGNNDARGALVEKSNDGTSYHLAGSLRIIYGYTFTSGTTADGSFMSNVAIFR
jgi:hypothetical protein